MNKEEKKKDWILETQRFQRIAKVPVESYEDLAQAYDDDMMKKK